jgi:hypothetical protein
MQVICPSRLSKNSFARERGRNFLLFVSQIAEKFLPPVQHKPSEETVFYALERRTNSCSASSGKSPAQWQPHAIS